MRTKKDILIGQQMVQSLINYCKRNKLKGLTIRELELSMATLEMELLSK